MTFSRSPATTCVIPRSTTEARGSLIHAHRSLSIIQRKLGVALLEVPTNTKGDEGPVTPRAAAPGPLLALTA